MKNKIFISLIVATTLNGAINFSDYASSGSTINKFLGSNSNVGDALKDFAKNKGMDLIKDTQSTAIKSVTSYILSKTGNAINADFMKYCYDYKPVPVNDFSFSFDICDMIGKVNTDPCDLAPNLESMGYYKKKTDYSNIKKYCEARTDDKPQFSYSTKENIKDIKLGNIIKVNQNKEEVENDKIEDTSIGLNNAKNNKVVEKAIYENDYKTYKVLKDVVKYSKKEEEGENPDFTTINVEYEKYSDYEKSVDDLASTYATFEEQLNIDKIKTDVLSKIEDLENESDKVSIVQKALADFKETAKKYEAVEIDRVLSLELNDENRIVYPTKDMVNKYPADKKAKIVYQIEKQKREEAFLIAKVKKRMNDLVMQCEVELYKVLKYTEPFDYDAELQKIKDKVGL
jgi:Txe/YoeB family toxin of Txe-Axe toxin-antitoxin module